MENKTRCNWRAGDHTRYSVQDSFIGQPSTSTLHGSKRHRSSCRHLLPFACRMGHHSLCKGVLNYGNTLLQRRSKHRLERPWQLVDRLRRPHTSNYSSNQCRRRYPDRQRCNQHGRRDRGQYLSDDHRRRDRCSGRCSGR